MQHTSLKQVKFNRGQVTDLLSERVDMGLQNACGTVYNNAYINRYGQLEEAPTVKLASKGGDNKNIHILSMFDTGTDLVLPIGMDYTGSTIYYYSWWYVPSITVRFVGGTPAGAHQKTLVKVCTRNAAGDYTEDGVTYYAWYCGGNIKKNVHDDIFGGRLYSIYIGTVYTSTPFPTTSDSIIKVTTTIYHSGALLSSTITDVAEADVVYTNTTTPTTNSDIFDTEIQPIGVAYVGNANYVVYKDTTYYRNNTSDTSRQSAATICVYSPLSKKDNTIITDLDNPIATYALTPPTPPAEPTPPPTKAYQFGQNVVLYDQNTQPMLLNLLEGNNGWYNAQLTVREGFFAGAFNNIFVRGINIDTPSDFTVPTSSYYVVDEEKGMTTKKIIKIKRNSAGGSFTQSLVGQVINCQQLSGSVQVREVIDANNLYAYVISPLIADSTDPNAAININFGAGQSNWLFGYENPFGEASATISQSTGSSLSNLAVNIATFKTQISNGGTYTFVYDGANWTYNGADITITDYGITYTGTPVTSDALTVVYRTAGYPDSVIYCNQRLIFGGNDRWGNLLCASRIGVINDFDPDTATESDAFSASIASNEHCRIVAMVQFSEELRLACTNGEYAVAKSSLTPSGIVTNGFSLRSQVGTSVGSSICDCGGLTAYVSRDKDAVYGTRFDLLKEQYSPISLTSQTSGIVEGCKQLVYLRNRRNQEGNLLVGLNDNGSLFGLEIDTNSGLVGAFKMDGYGLNISEGASLNIDELLPVEYALWGIATLNDFNQQANAKTYIVRFARHEFFNYTTGLTLPTDIAQFINQDRNYFRGLVSTEDEHSLAIVQGITDNGDGTSTVTFGDDVDPYIFTAGFLRQADWRSVEMSVGLATREMNKRIVKLEGVIKPQEFWNAEHTTLEAVSAKDFAKFFDLVNTKDVVPIENQFITELPLDIYTENGSVIWRRAFDNPTREKHWGFTAIAPFLVKSITVTTEFDEVP